MDRDQLLKVRSAGSTNQTTLGPNSQTEALFKNQGYYIEKAYDYERDLLNIPCSSNLSREDVMIVVGKLKN